MTIKRSKNAKRNIVSGFINKVLTIIFPFITRTVFIYTLGAEYLGLNSLFSSILQVLNLTELGFGSAVVYSMYKPIATDDNDTLCSLLNFYRKSYNAIGCIIAVIGVGLIPFLSKLISGTCPSELNLTALYLLYLSNTVFSYLFFAYKGALLNAFQRTDIASNVNTILIALLNIIQCLFLVTVRKYYAYYIYLVAMLVFTLLNNLWISFVVDKQYPQLKCRGHISKSMKHNIKIQVAGLFVTKVCQVSRNSFDSIFISAFLGLTLTAIYNNYYYVMNSIILVLGVIATSLLAGVGNSIITSSINKNYQDMNNINFVYMWLSGWCSVCLLCLYQPFMKLWVGDKMCLPFSAVIAMVIYFYSLKMGDIRGLYSDAAGLWWQNRWRAIAEAVCNLVLNYTLIQLFGIVGVILATVISLILINFILGSQIVFKYYFCGKRISQYFISHGIYAFVTVVVASITLLVCNQIKNDGIAGFLVKGVICIFVPNMLYLLVYFKTKRFKTSSVWLGSVLKFRII